jgi:hypothetical protein
MDRERMRTLRGVLEQKGAHYSGRRTTLDDDFSNISPDAHDHSASVGHCVSIANSLGQLGDLSSRHGCSWNLLVIAVWLNRLLLRRLQSVALALTTILE